MDPKGNAMNIRYITCSDPREDFPHKDAVDLLAVSPLVELGVQAHPSAMSAGMARNKWFSELLNISDSMEVPLNIAVHVNREWCAEFCQGLMSDEIKDWFRRRHAKTNAPLVRRWQLNIGSATCEFNAKNLAGIISDYGDREFIFPYNEKDGVKKAVSGLYKAGAKFSVLYDASGGYGMTPASWSPPVYENHPQGYAGGLCGENILENLDRISAVVPKDAEIWIDAEGKLKQFGSTRILDTARARDYVMKTLAWMERNNAK
jgi:hypothetical protein